MNVKKAIITAAGQGQNTLPLQTLVDQDGIAKSALRIIIEETISGGIDEICVVIRPGDEEAYLAAAGESAGRLRFVEQGEPRGYGPALYCARDFVDNEPFLHLVSDHLYLSEETRRCARQLIDVAVEESAAVSAVQSTRETKLPYYGAIGGKAIPNQTGLYLVERVLEKPTPTQAEQELLVPGLRAGHYLCYFGMHVLTPAVMEILKEMIETAGDEKSVPLSPALDVLAQQERYLALELRGRRYNMGVKFGVFHAQLALALEGEDREEMLAQLADTLASRAR